RVRPPPAGAPVPQRVEALLAGPRVPRPSAVRAAALLLACVAVSCAASTTGVAEVHHRVEVAQGEAPR
ncbi:M56 family peptidase, partial [Streptomyces echinoruber]